MLAYDFLSNPVHQPVDPYPRANLVMWSPEPLDRAVAYESSFKEMEAGPLPRVPESLRPMIMAVVAQSDPAPPPHASAPHPPSTPHSSNSHPANNQQHPPGKQHLSEWMQKNQGLSTDEQVKKLQQEQGFNKLTPQQQQSATNHLRQLNQMPPEQRQRELERVENIERLSPQQQEQLRSSAHQLGQMPPERQQAV